MKIRVTKDLVKRAVWLFSAVKGEAILTNQGLTRNELRALERKEIVFSQLMKNKDTGQIVLSWRLAHGQLLGDLGF